MITEQEIYRRRDMRDVFTFTIDPADAKDFDDALSFRLLENGNFEVGVHIADVTHYVRPGGPVDKEAQERGTSVYLVDRTVPMLPEKLCNKLCSLRPNEEKLTFSAARLQLLQTASEEKKQTLFILKKSLRSKKKNLLLSHIISGATEVKPR